MFIRPPGWFSSAGNGPRTLTAEDVSVGVIAETGWPSIVVPIEMEHVEPPEATLTNSTSRPVLVNDTPVLPPSVPAAIRDVRFTGAAAPVFGCGVAVMDRRVTAARPSWARPSWPWPVPAPRPPRGGPGRGAPPPRRRGPQWGPETGSR